MNITFSLPVFALCASLVFSGSLAAKVPSSPEKQFDNTKATWFQPMPAKTERISPQANQPAWTKTITIDPIITGPRR